MNKVLILIGATLLGLIIGITPGASNRFWQLKNTNLPQYNFQNRTPQETLNNFITALDSGNLDIIMTFIEPAYEARLHYRDQLAKVLQSKTETIFLIEKFRRMVPFEEENTRPETYQFILRNKNGNAESILVMHLDKNSGKWVIQDF